MKKALLRLDENLSIEDQLAKEVELLKKFDPDTELKAEFEFAFLEDLQKYLDE